MAGVAFLLNALLFLEIIFYTFHSSILLLLFAKCNTAFKGAFYSIFRIVIIGDLVNFLITTIVQKVSLFPEFMPFFSTSQYFISALINTLAISSVTIFLGHLLMAFNRFTLLWLPLKHGKIWKLKRWFYLVIFVLPFLNVCWRLHEPSVFQYLGDTKIMTFYKDPTVTSIHYISSTAIFLSTTLIAAFLNVLSFVKFYFYKSTNLSVNERHLLFVSLITFFAQLLRTSYNVAHLFSSKDQEIINVFVALFPLLNDIFALSGSISLLILSGTTRRLFITFYFCIPQSRTPIMLFADSCKNVPRGPSNSALVRPASQPPTLYY